MLDVLLGSIKGKSTIRARGRFPERILNIASTSKIYVSDVRREDEDSIIFCTGKKGGDMLLASTLEGISLELVDSYGIPVVLKKYKKRMLLTFFPLLLVVIYFVFSLFIWRVEIEGGDKKLRKEVSDAISQKGVHTGALKKKIDQYEIKRNTIIEVDDLSWIWVDLKGTTAKVKIHRRNPKPEMIAVNEPADVVATHDGVIEKMQVYCGVPLFAEGQSVKKGDVLVTGVFRSENENIPTYYHHAAANVILRLAKEKKVIIPRKTIEKTPTGNKKSVYQVKFEKNNINFSLNSGIPYAEYDRIEKKYALAFAGISFVKTTYLEATVSASDTDISKEISTRREAFLKSLSKKGMELIDLREDITENDDNVTVLFSADCRVRTDKEIPINKGETDGKNS